MEDALLSPGFLARLERLRVVAKRAVSSQAAGERRSSLKGASVEFADHREYRLGDDPRLLDWNAYARLEKLFVKLFLHEADLAVHILLDASASMGSPESDGSPGAATRPGEKFLVARRLAGALAYVTLANLDRAGLLALGGTPPPGGPASWQPERGRGRVLRMLRWLEGLSPSGRPDPVAALKRYAELQRRPGLSIVISDFLDPRFPEALKALLHHRHEVWCLHVLSREDLGEGLSGDFELVDCESGGKVEVSAAPEVIAAYRRNVAEFRANLERWCAARNVGYHFLEPGSDFEDVLLRVLRRRRLVST